MTNFSFITSTLFALITLFLTMAGVSYQDNLALYLGELFGILTILFFALGLILTMEGES